MDLGELRNGVVLEFEKCGFGADMDYTTLWRGCWVHLPEIGSLGYCGIGIRLCGISRGFSVGGF